MSQVCITIHLNALLSAQLRLSDETDTDTVGFIVQDKPLDVPGEINDESSSICGGTTPSKRRCQLGRSGYATAAITSTPPYLLPPVLAVIVRNQV